MWLFLSQVQKKELQNLTTGSMLVEKIILRIAPNRRRTKRLPNPYDLFGTRLRDYRELLRNEKTGKPQGSFCTNG